VTITASRLPGEDHEFYQFCYVTKQGSVRGASTPFQFRPPTENDCLLQVEDENGMIILQTKSDALEVNCPCCTSNMAFCSIASCHVNDQLPRLITAAAS